MRTVVNEPISLYDIVQNRTDEFVVLFNTDLTVQTAGRILRDLDEALDPEPPRVLILDLTRVKIIDDYGALVVSELRNQVKQSGGIFQVRNTSPEIDQILQQLDFNRITAVTPLKGKTKRNFFVHTGEIFLGRLFNLRYMVSFLGSVTLALIHVLLHPRSLRINDTISLMEKTGVSALPIVGLISFLLGLVIAFMSSLQLEQFGANIYVASLVAIAMVSELSPIMTAIVVAGRSGSAFAAEIGTMRISEEIDALFLMGFAPTLFLAVPRLIAAIIVVPLLTLFADIFGIFGGLVIGFLLLDLTLNAYITQTLEALSLFEVLWGLSKSVVFAALIAWVGCLRGFQTRGGPDAVGNAATSAVVTSIFLIILFDSIFAVVRSYL
jgi:phospholipid/cholesterol/gamma-HCH transport system permease protein